jgi:hypothetical protein
MKDGPEPPVCVKRPDDLPILREERAMAVHGRGVLDFLGGGREVLRTGSGWPDHP